MDTRNKVAHTKQFYKKYNFRKMIYRFKKLNLIYPNEKTSDAWEKAVSILVVPSSLINSGAM